MDSRMSGCCFRVESPRDASSQSNAGVWSFQGFDSAEDAIQSILVAFNSHCVSNNILSRTQASTASQAPASFSRPENSSIHRFPDPNMNPQRLPEPSRIFIPNHWLLLALLLLVL
jgi:hypothetical protein